MTLPWAKQRRPRVRVDLALQLPPFPKELLRIYKADPRITDTLRAANRDHRRAMARGDTQATLEALALSSRVAVALLGAELLTTAAEAARVDQPAASS